MSVTLESVIKRWKGYLEALKQDVGYKPDIFTYDQAKDQKIGLVKLILEDLKSVDSLK